MTDKLTGVMPEKPSEAGRCRAIHRSLACLKNGPRSSIRTTIESGHSLVVTRTIVPERKRNDAPRSFFGMGNIAVCRFFALGGIGRRETGLIVRFTGSGSDAMKPAKITNIAAILAVLCRLNRRIIAFTHNVAMPLQGVKLYFLKMAGAARGRPGLVCSARQIRRSAPSATAIAVAVDPAMTMAMAMAPPVRTADHTADHAADHRAGRSSNDGAGARADGDAFQRSGLRGDGHGRQRTKISSPF